MKCGSVREELSAYLDGEARDAAAIEEHVRGCKACASEYAALVQVSRAMRALTPPDVHPAFTTRVMASVREVDFTEEAPAPRRWGLTTLLTTVGVAASVAVIVWLTQPSAITSNQTGAAPPVVATGLSPETIGIEIQNRLAQNPDIDLDTLDPLAGGRLAEEAPAVAGADVLAALGGPAWWTALVEASEAALSSEDIIQRLDAADAAELQQLLRQTIDSTRQRG